ncbi:MAG TPA: hypothetical protein VGM88_00240 [Kofleriaceae bacterium]|jgi:hypothetical protein
MRITAAVLVVAVAGTGCTPKGKYAAGTVGIVAGAIGGGIALSSDCSHQSSGFFDTSGLCRGVAGVIGVSSLVLIIGGVALLVSGHHQRVAEDEANARILAPPPSPHLAPPGLTAALPDPTVAAPPSGDAALRQLVLDAKRAARRRDCAPVRAADERVRATDPAYYREAFASDPSIALCLAGP